MGRDISRSKFSEEDFEEFRQRLKQETSILAEWTREGVFDDHPGQCGFELEAWLVDSEFQPIPSNEAFLSELNSFLVVPELSKFNFEINSTPRPLTGNALEALASELDHLWKLCEAGAARVGSHVLAIGILPTVRDEMLTLDNMSPLSRYFALNEQVLRLREGKPLELNIAGRDALCVRHQDVMLEAAATSLQIHMQVRLENAVRCYNTSQILSAPLVAVAANSPYLFGKDLWEETRIPTFEQAVNVSCFRDCQGETVGRVTFGTGYARNSILEPFLENLDGYPILLPLVFEEEATWLSHLRLHNGTIWRWTRPLIGLNRDGTPHVRIEQRVPAAGPTRQDIIANIAFFLGMMSYFTQTENCLEEAIPFHAARKNFYDAARHGLAAEVQWTGGKTGPLKRLLEEVLVPAARKGLEAAGLAPRDVAHYLDHIIVPRIQCGQNGSTWQRAYIAKHGGDFQEMTHAYYINQKTGLPVHEWEV